MAEQVNVSFQNLSNVNADDLAVFKSRIIKLTIDFLQKIKLSEISFVVSTDNQAINVEKNDDKNEGKEQINFVLTEPQYSINDLVLDEDTFDDILTSIKMLKVKNKVFDEWGLNKLEPFPRIALNFHGPSGTGKTMAAHAIAKEMEKKIILASYAEIESKYHGDGPKNVKQLFKFAHDNDAILFIDEADSLLSKRLSDVSQGSEQAINSMRSQLLIEIERFSGVVIFATNLVKNYDKAFATRVKNIKFHLPNQINRKKIWEKHLNNKMPIGADLDLSKLAEYEDICGRDIKNAIINAAIRCAINGESGIEHNYFKTAIEKIIEEKKAINE